METFIIDNPLLIQAIVGNRCCDKAPLKDCAGFLYDSGAEQIGRAFLEFCYSEIFNIRRFPGYETYNAISSNRCRYLVETSEITEDDIKYACNQLYDLYKYTQARLKEEVGDTFCLHRRLAGFEIDAINEQNSRGCSKLFLPTNIISSYSYTDAHLFNVVLVRDVNIEDIVMVDYMTSYVNQVNCHKLVPLKDAEGEVWVLNRNRFGKIQVKREWLHEISGSLLTPIKERYKTSAEGYLTKDDGRSLIESQTLSIKPCEWNALTKWLIRRNEKQIEELFR